MTTLEDQFQQECEVAIEECRAFNPPYIPTAWIGMMRRHGAVEAARRLFLSGDIQSGFERLIRKGRMDLTVEMAVLHPRWNGLFDRPHREAAWWRLAQAAREQR